MITIAALFLAYGLTYFVGVEHGKIYQRAEYGTDDVNEWRRAIQGPIVRVIDGDRP
jgi:hypothetical protein